MAQLPVQLHDPGVLVFEGFMTPLGNLGFPGVDRVQGGGGECPQGGVLVGRAQGLKLSARLAGAGQRREDLIEQRGDARLHRDPGRGVLRRRGRARVREKLHGDAGPGRARAQAHGVGSGRHSGTAIPFEQRVILDTAQVVGTQIPIPALQARVRGGVFDGEGTARVHAGEAAALVFARRAAVAAQDLARPVEDIDGQRRRRVEFLPQVVVDRQLRPRVGALEIRLARPRAAQGPRRRRVDVQRRFGVRPRRLAQHEQVVEDPEGAPLGGDGEGILAHPQIGDGRRRKVQSDGLPVPAVVPGHEQPLLGARVKQALDRGVFPNHAHEGAGGQAAVDALPAPAVIARAVNIGREVVQFVSGQGDVGGSLGMR